MTEPFSTIDLPDEDRIIIRVTSLRGDNPIEFECRRCEGENLPDHEHRPVAGVVPLAEIIGEDNMPFWNVLRAVADNLPNGDACLEGFIAGLIQFGCDTRVTIEASRKAA